jgi:hypothetical protein
VVSPKVSQARTSESKLNKSKCNSNSIVKNLSMLSTILYPQYLYNLFFHVIPQKIIAIIAFNKKYSLIQNKMEKLTEDLLRDENPDDLPQIKKDIPICGMCKKRYYQQYFQVTTQKVLVKLLYSIIFVCNNFPEVDSDKTDLYGPFWIYATMAFTLAISQNIYSFLSRPEGMKFVYTVNYVPSAFAIIYSFGVCVPLAFNFL